MSPSKLIRHRDLLNLLVIDRATTDELGRVEVVWMHPPAHRVLGFICKTGPLGGPKLAFNLKQIHQLGPKSIVANGNAVGTNTSEVKLLESLIGLEVWSDKGNKIGKIIDCLFDLKSGVITQYLFRSDGWRGVTGGVYQLPTGSIQRFGKKRVFVSGTVTRKPKIYQEGLEEKLVKAGDRIQSRFTDLTHQASNQLYQVTDQATHRVQSLTEQATQRVQGFGQQLTEETQNLTQTAKQHGQSLFSRVQEQARSLGEEFSLEDLSFTDSRPSPPETSLQDDDFVWDSPSQDDASQAEEASDPWEDLSSDDSQVSSVPNDSQLVSEDLETEQPDPEEHAWSSGLGDIPLKDLEDDDPWI
ncbi:MAG: PRC-barrel domain-containing protein [Cyanobacteria bacterium P01_A01_bin.17]